MRIEHLQIRNFKKFSDYSLTLHPQFTLLVGDNGTGKTSLLDALSIAAGVWLVNPPDSTLSNSRRNISTHEIRLQEEQRGDRIQFVECKPVQIQVTGNIGNSQSVCWLRQIKETGIRTSNTEAREALDIIAGLYERQRSGEAIIFPVIAYYGAGRAWLPSNEHNKRTAQGSQSPARRWDAFYDCFAERVRMADLHAWFQSETLAAVNRQGQMRPGYEIVKWAVLLCIPEAEDLWFDPDRAEIVVAIAQTAIPFSNLSAGQKMMVALIADIAIKVITQNAAFIPDEFTHHSTTLPAVLQNTPGLVLIDELDVHLHPKWQRRVVDDLKRTFPSIQFVCTTHSPFIIQSISQGELRILDDIEPTQALDYENQSIEDIAEEIQLVETPQQSQKAHVLAQATERYFELIQAQEGQDSPELIAAEAAYREASEPFSANPGLTALLKLEAMAKAKELDE